LSGISSANAVEEIKTAIAATNSRHIEASISSRQDCNRICCRKAT
jgi:hypothetical protein